MKKVTSTKFVLLLKIFLGLMVMWFIGNLVTMQPVEEATNNLRSPRNISFVLMQQYMKKMIAFKKSASSDIYIPDKLSAGYEGQPVTVPEDLKPDEKKSVTEGWKQHACNVFISDLISVTRQLPDFRDKWCKQPGKYLKDLPETTVVICFHNEAWSLLLRTVHSVLDSSPPQLLKEIILVDDFSDMAHLMEPLETYMSLLSRKISIVRAAQREGLVRARLLGFKLVTTPTVTFLDSHCECTKGWLEPLLDRIARNKSTVVFPNILRINENTFEIQRKSGEVSVGGFNWMMEFIWIPQSDREKARRKHIFEPVQSATMPGGLFAIDCKFFKKLGTYDAGLEIWGGENLELSFKTWMCGGVLEEIPCSHVGHVFKDKFTHSWTNKSDVVKNNLVRVAEVWMDEYANDVYCFIGQNKGNFGDVSSRRALRSELQCKSFDWYLRNVYPELQLLNSSAARGEIRSLNFDNICVDVMNIRTSEYERQLPSPYPCHGMGGNQFWLYTKNGELKKDMTNCLEYSQYTKEVSLQKCDGRLESQLWLYKVETKLIKHPESKLCLAITPFLERVTVLKCDAEDTRQHWLLQKYNEERLTPVIRQQISQFTKVR